MAGQFKDQRGQGRFVFSQFEPDSFRSSKYQTWNSMKNDEALESVSDPLPKWLVLSVLGLATVVIIATVAMYAQYFSGPRIKGAGLDYFGKP